MRAPIAKQTKRYDFKVGEKVRNVLKEGQKFEIESLMENNFTRCYILDDSLERIQIGIKYGIRRNKRGPSYKTVLIRMKNLKRIKG